MALQRLDAFVKYEAAGVFSSAIVRYTGDYGSRTEQWEVSVMAADVVATPTNAQVCAAADAMATTKYNDWMSSIDNIAAAVAAAAAAAVAVTVTEVTGMADTVVA